MPFLFDNFVLDSEQGVLRKEGELIPLSPKVFETLRVLVAAQGRVVSKQEFMDALWRDSFVEEANLTQNIFVLRKVLGTTPEGRLYIETVPKRGYRFSVAVTPVTGEEATEGALLASQGAAQAEAPGLGAVPPGAGAATGPVTDRWRSRRFVAILSFPLLVLVFTLGGSFALRTSPQAKIGGYQRLTNDGMAKDMIISRGVIVPVGGNVYFNELKSNVTLLAKVPAAGGEVTHEPVPAPVSQVVGLGRGERSLLFGSRWLADDLEPLMAGDPATGAFTPVDDLHAQDANWSHDRTRLAYARFGKLFVRSVGGPDKLVASVKGLVYWPRWSPDDRVLRFSENYDGYHDRMWEVASTGADLHQLLAHQPDSERMCCGSWTPSGRAFLYMSNELQSSSIHVRPEPESAWSRLAHPARWSAQRSPIDIAAAPLDRWGAAVPSLDGGHVYAIGEQLHGRLVRIDPSSRKAEPYLGGMSAEGLDFSPDRHEMVWTAYPEGTLWASRTDGSERRQLTSAPLVARFPRWSPDGKTVVFVGARPGLDWQLYTVPANSSGGGYQARLLLPESTGQGVATWSPDGKALAFGHILEPSQARAHTFAVEIYRPADGKVTIVPQSAGLWTARWSPDGRYLSAVTRDNHTLRLYDMQAGTWVDLAHGSVNDVVWTLDGKYLFFDTDYGSAPMLYRVRLSDRRLEAWADLRDVRRAGFFAPWLGVAPDGAPILLEDASIQELYSVTVKLP